MAAASEPGRVVTNGMSQYSRAERNANAAIVVGITPEQDYPGHPLAGIAFQRHWEEQAFKAGGGTYDAPGQRVGDFLAGRPSTGFENVISSYRPGVFPTDISQCLPDYAVAALREAVAAATTFCLSQGVDLAAMEALSLGGFERLAAVENAIKLAFVWKAARLRGGPPTAAEADD